jgi:uncharacterized protein (TIGR03118 family)
VRVKNLNRVLALAPLVGICLAGSVAAEKKSGYSETDLVVNKVVSGVPTLTDANGIVHVATFADAHLVNPWGIAESQTSPFWVSDNGAGVSTLYNTAGSPLSLVVSIPAPGDPLGNGGAPTGTVFIVASAAGAFMISGFTAAGMPTTRAAVFLFATEDGTIVGWNPGVNPAGFNPAKAGTYGIIAAQTPDAVYKGLAIATDSGGRAHLYATNFHARTVDVFSPTFQLVNAPGAFVDEKLPEKFSPFNVQPITMAGSTRLFVTYAVRDDLGKDDVKGEGHGIVNTFDLEGQSLERFAQHGQLNSPWGVALAPEGFGDRGGTLWIGNFGNGHIDAYDPITGRFIGKVRDAHGQAIVIDGLWALKVGNGGNGGDRNTLYFTAGPNDESDGLFGSLRPN